jgi:quinol monooxygenase YgiN
MWLDRRAFALGTVTLAAVRAAEAESAPNMYGLIGKMLAKPGQRDALIQAILAGTQAMPGCLSYVVATDPSNADAIWITEAWTDAAHHQASLKLPEVQAAIAKARPLIAGFGERFETSPVGGVGLKP